MVRLRVMTKLEGIMRRPLEVDPSDEVVKQNYLLLTEEK